MKDPSALSLFIKTVSSIQKGVQTLPECENSHLPIAVTKKIQPPKTKLVISSSDQYPRKSAFPQYLVELTVGVCLSRYLPVSILIYLFDQFDLGRYGYLPTFFIRSKMYP